MNVSKLTDISTTPRIWGDQFKGQRRILMCPVCKNAVIVDGGDTIFMGIACSVHKDKLPIAFDERKLIGQ